MTITLAGATQRDRPVAVLPEDTGAGCGRLIDFNRMNVLDSVNLTPRARLLRSRWHCATEFARHPPEKLDEMAVELLGEIATWQELTVAKVT